MERRRRGNQIDLTKMIIFMLKRVWLIIICSVIGFRVMCFHTTRFLLDTYTAFGAMYGAAVGICILALLFLLKQKVTSESDITERYSPPVLASMERVNANNEEPSAFMLTKHSPISIMESYAKLRMNLPLAGKTSHTVVITSSISGEGKTTIASNLAVFCAMGGEKVPLVDGDLRHARQREVFEIDKSALGLSDILVGNCNWQDAILKDIRDSLDVLPA